MCIYICIQYVQICLMISCEKVYKFCLLRLFSVAKLLNTLHTHTHIYIHSHTPTPTYNISFMVYIECIIKIESVKKYEEAETRNML